MKQLILIRHSISQQDATTPAKYWGLTDEGIALCAPLADLLRQYGIHKIYTSDEQKASLTGEYIAEHLEIDFEISPNLHETHAITAPYFHDTDEFRACVKEAMLHPNEILYGEESFNHAYIRFERQLWELMRKHQEETLAVVTHGRVMSMYIGKACNLTPYNIWEQLDLPAFAVISIPDMHLVTLVPSIRHKSS